MPFSEERFEALSRELDAEQRRLERIIERLASVADHGRPSELQEGLADIARDACNAAVAMFVAQDDDEHVAVIVTDASVVLAERPSVRRAPLLAGAFLADDVLCIDDASRWSPESARLYGSLADGRVLRSWVIAPVRGARGALFGRLLVADPNVRGFDARHERLVDALARQLAFMLENHELLDEQGRIATGLQETLLPPVLPVIDGFEVAARYRPAGEIAAVGGDFYDVFPSADGTWMIVLGDVCGVGPEAAAVTGVARYSLRAVARQDPSPSRSLHAVNDAIWSRRSDSRFCSAVMLALHPGPGDASFTWSNAGHPPPLLLRDDGTATLLDARLGTLLGVFPRADYLDDKVVLAPGDALILYTDGVTEARHEGDQFGEARLLALAGTCAGRTADGIARRIELAVIDHLRAVPEDDIAIVVIRATPSS
jgi:serine phosphatase RsbU (regulator of sigma subunit)